MAIKVGINEDVQLKSAARNDKGTLVINFTQGTPLEETATDDLFNNKAGVRAGNGTNVMIWGFQAESNGQERDADRIAKDVVAVRSQLQHILEGYMTKDNAKLDPYANTGLTAENFESKLKQQATLDLVYKNLVDQFIEKVSTLGDAINNKFRLLLVRKSESNHYGTFRRNFIEDNPFWESMSIPKEASGLAFTKFEINKGLNNPNAIQAPAADTAASDQSTSDDILGSR